MSAEGKFCHGMVVAAQADGLGVAYFEYDLYAPSGLLDAKSASGENFLVALGVEFGEAFAKLKFLAVDGDGAEGAFLAFHSVGRQRVGIDAEEIAHTGAFQLKIASHTVVRSHMDDIFPHIAENPAQHVVEMHTDVGGNAAALVDVAFPRGIVPIATRGDVSQVDVVNLVFRPFVDFLFQRQNLVMKAQLQDAVSLVTSAFFHIFDTVEAPRIEHERFLTDDISTIAEAIARVSIMQVVGRTNTQEIQRLPLVFQARVVTVEEFLLGEKRCQREKWSEDRQNAKIKITENVVNKTSELAADNATIAAGIKRKALMILDRLLDDYQFRSTEHQQFGQGSKDISRLRDLTAAYKDLTGDLTISNNSANELLQSLIDLERGRHD